jgi:beta-lactamase class A
LTDVQHQEQILTLEWGDPGLKPDIEAIERESGGTLCLAARDLRTGHVVRYHSDRRCKTASVIKLPILTHAAMAVREGLFSWGDPLILTDGEKVGGSGVLTQLTAGLELTLRDACVLMTIVSDNTATNMLIERMGVGPINARMRSLGLPLTTLYRKSYTPDTDASRPYGLGMTTPDEMADLLGKLAEGRVGDGDVSREILKILAGQTLRDSIPRALLEGWKYAGKTGGIDGVRNDVGLVTAPDGSEFALALFCQDLQDVQWTPDNTGLLALANVTRRLLRANP